MTAYDIEPWHDLFVMVGGAAAALAGLLFVAVSLNTEQILAARALPALAARAVATLITLLLLSVAVLVPDQSARRVGVELLVLGGALVVGVVWSEAVELGEIERARWAVFRISMSVVSTVPLLLGGVTLVAGAGGGLDWAVLEVVTGFVAATYYGWVLLIEIRR